MEGRLNFLKKPQILGSKVAENHSISMFYFLNFFLFPALKFLDVHAFFLRINIFQASLEVILNISSFQPQKILR